MLLELDLSSKIAEAVGINNTTKETDTYSKAIITTLKAASVINAVGSITADTIPTSPIINGKADNGTLININNSIWLSIMTSGFPTANPATLAEEATKSCLYLQEVIKVSFSAGTITGISTAVGPPTPAPGPLITGAGTLGKLSGISGQVWAQRVMPPLADPLFSSNIYEAIAKYIMDNAEASYLVGTVNGTCPGGPGGPLELGAGIGGVII